MSGAMHSIKYAGRASASIVALSVVALAACASAGGGAVTSANTKAPSSEPRPASTSGPDLPSRPGLPDEVRDALTERMMRHGDDMSRLTVAVLMLEYDLVHLLATDMAREPRLGRPAEGESGTLNTLLPAGFFVQQDALAASASALAAAALGRDDVRLAASFGDLTKSCVSCHSAYLHAELDTFDERLLERALPCNPEDACGENERR